VVYQQEDPKAIWELNRPPNSKKIRKKFLTTKNKNRQQLQQVLTCKAAFVGTRNFMTAGSPANNSLDFASNSNV